VSYEPSTICEDVIVVGNKVNVDSIFRKRGKVTDGKGKE
jgi:hypothetical protein